MSKVDWKAAGKRLRHSPRQHGRNPDWNDAAQRWKTAEEYAGETLDIPGVVAAAACPRCGAAVGEHCNDSANQPMIDGPHAQRRSAAGATLIAKGWKIQ